MNKLLLSLTMLAFVSLPANAVRNGTSVKRTNTEFTNLVRITLGGGTCTGTRINFDTVLTAAHCFGEDKSRSKFRVDYLNAGKSITEKIKVSDVIIKSRDLDQELAIFKLSPRIDDSSFYKPSQIYNYQQDEFYPGEKFLFAGYGMDKSEDTSRLKKGHLKYTKSKTKVESFQVIDRLAMEIRNEIYLEELALIPVVDKASELPEVELNDCKNSGLGWRGRRSCRKQNDYMLFQRELELKSIAYEVEQEKIKREAFLKTPIFKTELVKGHHMITLAPLSNEDELLLGERVNQLPCPGDSGGPLYKELPNGERLIVGIVSHISTPSGTARRSNKAEGYKTCAKAFAANYIPLSQHEDFLRQFNIIF